MSNCLKLPMLFYSGLTLGTCKSLQKYFNYSVGLELVFLILHGLKINADVSGGKKLYFSLRLACKVLYYFNQCFLNISIELPFVY